MTNIENNMDFFEPYVLKKNDIIFYSRVIPNCGLYDVLELKIRTIMPTYFVGVDSHTKQSFLFGYNVINKKVFKDRKEALKFVKAEEKKHKKISNEIYYDEF